MAQQFKKILTEMVGKVYVYGKNTHYVQDFKIDDDMEKVTINTNNNRFERSFDHIDAFLKYWEPADLVISSTGMIPYEPEPMLNDEEVGFVGSMAQEVMNNIQKVKDDPKYIPQAASINGSVNTMINLMKLKIMATKGKVGRPRKTS